MSECRAIDPLVTPYIDGELAEGERRAVDAHLKACPPCHSRVVAERAVRETLVARRRDIAATAAPPTLRAACYGLCVSRQSSVVGRQSSRQSTVDSRQNAAPGAPHSALRMPRSALRRAVPFALAASLVATVGGAFLYQMTASSATVLAAELTADHLKCLGLNAVLGTHQTATAVESAMLAEFGWHVRLPENPAQVGLELVGSRPCLYGQGEIAHIMYRHDGRPVSLFMLPKSARAEQLVDVLGHQAKIWCVGNRTLVLLAHEPRKDVERLADYVQASLH